MHLSTLQYVYQKRRFRKVLGGLIILSIIFMIIIVPIEKPHGQINNMFDSLWWSVATLTSTGYGDIIPVTVAGKFIGMFLQLIGALIFGVVVALVSISLNRVEDEFILLRMRDRFDEVQKVLERLEKNSAYLIKKEEEREKRKSKKNLEE